MDYGKITTEFRRLAILGAHEIMDVYGTDDFGVEAKDDDSPVTIADKRADAVISAGITAAFPDITLITEEQADSHSKGADVFIIVDPLDGTKEFIKRRGDFTVNIALVENGVPTRGVVYAPAKGRMFFTDETGNSVEESGAFDPEVLGETKPIRVTSPDGPLTVVASKSHRTPETDEYVSKYEVKDFESAGSSLKFCLVACGDADIYPRLGPTMEWDTAAGDAVLRGAGGVMVDFATHATFAYGKPDYRNGFFIAASPDVTLIKG